MKYITLFPLLFCSTAFANGGEVYFQGGALQNADAPNTTWTLQSGFISQINNKFGVGFSYLNEGHSENNHRDGFAVQGWYTDKITNSLYYQVGTGPYISNNNTLQNENRLNDFHVGLISSATLKYYLQDGWYLRAQYNNILMTTTNSNSVLFGIGKDWNNSVNNSEKVFDKVYLSVWSGSSRTTQIGTQENATPVMLDIKQQYNISRISFGGGLLYEGNTGLVDRTGMYFQGWYDYKPSEQWTLSGGIGPYLAADNKRSTEQIKLMMAGSIRIVRDFGDYFVGGTFTRITSFYNRDQDLFMIGFGRKF
jgi:hypothetical protein